MSEHNLELLIEGKRADSYPQARRELSTIRANQVVWKFPPFKPQEFLGRVVSVETIGGGFVGGLVCEVSDEGMEFFGQHQPRFFKMIKSIAILPQPPTKTGEGV